MRSSFTVGLAYAVAVVVPTSLHAGEKVLGNLVSPGGVYDRLACTGAGFVSRPASPAFVPGSTKAKLNINDRCKATLKLNGLATLAPGDGLPGSGDEVICLINFIDDAGPTCGSFILRGEVNSAGTTAKVKLNGPSDLPGVCPMTAGVSLHITGAECYQPPPVAYSAGAGCAAVGGTFTPLVSDPSQGLCFPAGAHVDSPITGIIAVLGLTF